MGANKFPEFWYESNACWGYVKSIDDLKEKCKLQIDKQFGGLDFVDDFLDKSHMCINDTHNFGTRREHTGKQTLRMFLNSFGVDYSVLYNE